MLTDWKLARIPEVYFNSMHKTLMHLHMYLPTYLNQLISFTNTQQASSAVVEEVFAHNREQDIFSRLGKLNLQAGTKTDFSH